MTIDVGDLNTIGTCYDDGGITAPKFPKVTYRMPDMAGIVFLEKCNLFPSAPPSGKTSDNAFPSNGGIISLSGEDLADHRLKVIEQS